MNNRATPALSQDGMCWQQLWDVQPGLQDGSGHWQEGLALGACRRDLALAVNPNLAIPTKREESSLLSEETSLKCGLTSFPSQNHKKIKHIR